MGTHGRRRANAAPSTTRVRSASARRTGGSAPEPSAGSSPLKKAPFSPNGTLSAVRVASRSGEAHRSMKRTIVGWVAAASLLTSSIARADTFAAGSLIVPMDTTYQDNGMLKAFGLVYDLLRKDVP